jgi:hypothetical protein
MAMTTTTEQIDAVEAITDALFPEPEQRSEVKLLPDPKLAGLIWALSLSAGRMPMIP